MIETKLPADAFARASLLLIERILSTFSSNERSFISENLISEFCPFLLTFSALSRILLVETEVSEIDSAASKVSRVCEFALAESFTEVDSTPAGFDLFS